MVKSKGKEKNVKIFEEVFFKYLPIFFNLRKMNVSAYAYQINDNLHTLSRQTTNSFSFHPKQQHK